VRGLGRGFSLDRDAAKLADAPVAPSLELRKSDCSGLRVGAAPRHLVLCGVIATSLCASAPAAAQAVTCNAPQRPMQQIELMFGRNVAGHLQGGKAAWSRFLAREITPRFPDGLTILDAAGQWRDPAGGRVMREPSKMVIIVTADDMAARERIAAIVTAYKQRFRQRSVGVISHSVCAAF
jgi:uncharacterized protein DUF3574